MIGGEAPAAAGQFRPPFVPPLLMPLQTPSRQLGPPAFVTHPEHYLFPPLTTMTPPMYQSFQQQQLLAQPLAQAAGRGPRPKRKKKKKGVQQAYSQFLRCTRRSLSFSWITNL